MQHIAEHELIDKGTNELCAYIRKRMADSGETEMVMTARTYSQLRLQDRHPDIEFIHQAGILKTGLFAVVCGFKVWLDKDADKNA